MGFGASPETVIDYHLHLWSHDESSVVVSVSTRSPSTARRRRRHGVHELALTEHLYRFVESCALRSGDFWNRWGHEPTSPIMADYFDFHARNSLDEYVTFAQLAKYEGLPVKVGLEVDYYRDQMDDVAALLAQYPFDVLIGSVHWLEHVAVRRHRQRGPDGRMAHARRRPVLGRLHRWPSRSWRRRAAVDVLAHPDVIKVAGYYAIEPAEPLGTHGRRRGERRRVGGVLVAGWFKPVGEQYPAEGFLDRLVARGVTFTTASDAHRLERVGARAGDLADLLEARGVHELATYEARASGHGAAARPPWRPSPNCSERLHVA